VSQDCFSNFPGKYISFVVCKKTPQANGNTLIKKPVIKRCDRDLIKGVWVLSAV